MEDFMVNINGIKPEYPDSVIVAIIESKFFTDSVIRGLNIQVEALAGIVTLTGIMPTEEIGDKAILIAKNAAGVKTVISHFITQH